MGRPVGAKTKAIERIAGIAKANDLKTPLEILLTVMNDEKISAALRVDAAGKAAPYCHRRMPQELEHSGPGKGPIPINVAIVPAKDLMKESTDAADDNLAPKPKTD